MVVTNYWVFPLNELGFTTLQWAIALGFQLFLLRDHVHF